MEITLKEIAWVAIPILVFLVLVCIIFREELSKKLKGLKGLDLEISSKSLKLIARFDDASSDLGEFIRRKNIKNPEKFPDVARNYSGGSFRSRDAFFSAWNTLTQELYLYLRRVGVDISDGHNLGRVLSGLSQEGKIPKAISNYYGILQEYHDYLEHKKRAKPSWKIVNILRENMSFMIAWMLDSVPKPDEVYEEIVMPKRRETLISGAYLPPSASRPTACLVGISGPLQGKRYPVVRSNMLIGSLAQNDMVMAEDNGISRQHALITFDAKNGALCIQDTSSSNGTFVNRQRVSNNVPVALHLGDQIQLGSSVFVVSPVEAPVPEMA